MKTKYKIRYAKSDDRQKIQQLFIASVANQKNLFNPEMVNPIFVEDFVNKVIDQGNMIVVENLNNELELIGEIHYYNTSVTNGDHYMKEIIFLSRMEGNNDQRETELVEWLYGEIENKHRDVFSVMLNTPVKSMETVKHFVEKGIQIIGNFTGRLSGANHKSITMLPLSWINPSFN